MAAYAQFGYNYPTANQLLNGVAAQSSSVAAVAAAAALSSSMTASNIGIVNGNAPSPLSGVNDASLSPSGGSTATTTGGNTAADPLSPGALSQTSNNANNNNPTSTNSLSILHSSTANAIGLSLSLNADVSGVGGVDADVGIGIDAGAVGSVGSVVHDSTTPCCENGRPIMTDPVSGQTVCSCQYDSARLALSSYSRMPGGAGASGGVGVYGTPYPSSEQNPYPSIGVDSSAFYSPLSNPYALKESSGGSDMSAWTSASLQPTTGYYSYDPIAAYGYGSSYDLAARRKNATRESTATLKAWLSEHKKNPYPTKGEKIMLAIITKMTLTQVSTWFANARRRLKKENKMTWEPKNKTDDDDDAMLSDDEKDKDADDIDKMNGGGSGVGDAVGSGGAYGSTGMGVELRKDDTIVKSEMLGKEEKADVCSLDESKFGDMPTLRTMGSVYNSPYSQHPSYHPYQQQHPSSYYQQQQPQQQQHYASMTYGAPSQLNVADEFQASKNLLRAADCGIPLPASKPKIWSLADTVACKTPPPPLPPPIQMTTYQQQQQQQQQQSLLQQSRQQYYQQMPAHLQQQINQQHNLQSNNNSVNLPPAHNNNNSTINNNSTSLSMMNGYVGALPYSRIPMAYAAAGNSSNNNNNNSTFLNLSSSSSSSGSNSNSNHSAQIGCGSSNSSASTPPAAMTQPPTHLTAQQYHQLKQQQHQHQQQQQRLGFTEIQPDTPPQTPPNMKLSGSSSGAGGGAAVGAGAVTLNQLARSGLMGTPTSNAASMCYSSGAPNGLNVSQAPYVRHGAGVGLNYALAAARAEG